MMMGLRCNSLAKNSDTVRESILKIVILISLPTEDCPIKVKGRRVFKPVQSLQAVARRRVRQVEGK